MTGPAVRANGVRVPLTWLAKVLAAGLLLVVVYELAGWLDRGLSTLPPPAELMILLGVAAGGLAIWLAARRPRAPAHVASVSSAAVPPVATPLPLPQQVVVPEVVTPRASEAPVVDPSLDLTSSLARAASVLESASSVLETVTQTCASVLDRIEDNRREALAAADAVAQLLSRPRATSTGSA